MAFKKRHVTSIICKRGFGQSNFKWIANILKQFLLKTHGDTMLHVIF